MEKRKLYSQEYRGMEGKENMYEFQRWGLGLVISKNWVQDVFMYLSLTPNQSDI